MKIIATLLNQFSRKAAPSQADFFDQRLVRMTTPNAGSRRARPSVAPSAFRAPARQALAH